MKHVLTAIALVAVTTGSTAWAHGDAPAKSKATKAPVSTEEKPFGREGDPKKVNQTIQVGMADTMRFTPGEITVKRGDTVKFVAKNGGKILHEMVLGTMKELKEHAELMRKFPGMEHDAPYMAHVSAGKSGNIVWQFTEAGEFYFACLVPGHFEAGMIGKVIVK